jgi:predicted nucleotide-binding protein
MSTQGFTYQKPNERSYLFGVIKVLELAGEAQIADMLRGAKCTIRDTTTYSRKRWDAYWTSVDFAVLIPKLRTLDEDAKQKLIDVCSKTMPAEVGFDIMDVTMSPLLAAEQEPQETPGAETGPSSPPSTKVFVVHGHDSAARKKLAQILEKMGLQPVILHEQADKGRALIEKLEEDTSDVGYAFVLLTPDDVGSQKGRKGTPKPRARQNVIFEFGYLMGKLGRQRICCLYSGGVERPSDIEGIVYVPFRKSVSEAYEKILKELRAAGYNPKAEPAAHRKRLEAIRWVSEEGAISYKRIEEMATKSQTFSKILNHEPADADAIMVSVRFPASVAKKMEASSLALRRSTYAYGFEGGEPQVTILAKELHDELEYAGVHGNPSLVLVIRYPE